MSQFPCHLYMRTQEFGVILGSGSQWNSLHASPIHIRNERMNCKRKHADSNVKAHVRGSSPKGLIIQEIGAGISIAVQEMVNPEYASIQTAIIQCVHINHAMHQVYSVDSMSCCFNPCAI